MNFDSAFLRLLGHEGGYVNNPRDSGGETNFGISRRAYPGEDIRGMTVERAKEIYRRDYWGPAGCDVVPDALRFDLFDVAVNSGVGQAIQLLQRTVNEVEDGVLGPHTLMAVQSMAALRICARFCGVRLTYMTTLKTWPDFGRGWAVRVASNLMEI